MRTHRVSGRFVTEEGEAVAGEISFIPSRIWLEEDGVTYPCLAPEVVLEDGGFAVDITGTDTDDLPWHYQVISPVGKWTIKAGQDDSHFLCDLLPKRTFKRQ